MRNNYKVVTKDVTNTGFPQVMVFMSYAWRGVMKIFITFFGPIGLPMIITAAVAVFLIVHNEYRILNVRESGILADMRSGIDAIRICAWLIMLFSLVNPLFGLKEALASIPAATTNDPRVMFQGLFDILLPIYFAMLLLSMLYLAWFLLRYQLDRKLKSAS